MIPDHKPKAQIIDFPRAEFEMVKQHVTEVRRLFDWPGIPYHDANEPMKFNRWYWHNAPLLKRLHHSPWLVEKASELAGQRVRPSYCFLSMYGPEGTCPLHSDRPQCQFTIDLLVNYDGAHPWPIYVESQSPSPTVDPKDGTEPFPANGWMLKEGQALFYSGTGQRHFRRPGSEVGLRKADLVFFHFVPLSYMGGVD